MYKEDLAVDIGKSSGTEKHASLAEGSHGIEAKKARIVFQTHQLAEAMKSLNTDDVESMRKDFDEVFAMYKEDLAVDIGKSNGTEKHASLAEGSEGIEAKKASIVEKTKKLAQAMGSLKTDDVESMQKDFDEVFAMYKEDLAVDIGKSSETEKM